MAIAHADWFARHRELHGSAKTTAFVGLCITHNDSSFCPIVSQDQPGSMALLARETKFS
jgi:hypothetical protein